MLEYFIVLVATSSSYNDRQRNCLSCCGHVQYERDTRTGRVNVIYTEQYEDEIKTAKSVLFRLVILKQHNL